MKFFRVIGLILAGTLCASAQFGGLLNKVKGGKGGDSTAVMTQGEDLLSYVTLATDCGMKAVEELARAFPDEKILGVKELAAKYNEMKTSQGDQNLNADLIKVASRTSDEMAKLEGDWESHLTDKSAAVRKADRWLALVVLADAQAAMRAPETLKSLQGAVENLRSDPTQVAKVKRIMTMVDVLTVVAKEMPGLRRAAELTHLYFPKMTRARFS